MAGRSANIFDRDYQITLEQVLLNNLPRDQSQIPDLINIASKKENVFRFKIVISLFLLWNHINQQLREVILLQFRKISKRTDDILKIFDHSITVLKETYFYSQQSQTKLFELKQKISNILINKSIDYSQYLQLLLAYSKDKIIMQIQKVQEFVSKLKKGQISTEYYAALVQALIFQKSQKKKKPIFAMSTANPIQVTKNNNHKEMSKSAIKYKESQKQEKSMKNSLFQNYNILDLSKNQFGEKDQEDREKMLMVLLDKNKHIKDQINNHLEDIQGIESNINRSPEKIRKKVRRYNEDWDKFYWQKSGEAEQTIETEKIKRILSSSKKRTTSHKKQRIVNFEFNFDELKKESKSNYLYSELRLPTSLKARSHIKIVKNEFKNEECPESFQTKRFIGKQFRQRISEVKAFWQGYNHKDQESFNKTAPIKNLRSKRHVKMSVLKSAKLVA